MFHGLNIICLKTTKLTSFPVSLCHGADSWRGEEARPHNESWTADLEVPTTFSLLWTLNFSFISWCSPVWTPVFVYRKPAFVVDLWKEEQFIGGRWRWRDAENLWTFNFLRTLSPVSVTQNWTLTSARSPVPPTFTCLYEPPPVSMNLHLSSPPVYTVCFCLWSHFHHCSLLSTSVLHFQMDFMAFIFKGFVCVLTCASPLSYKNRFVADRLRVFRFLRFPPTCFACFPGTAPPVSAFTALFAFFGMWCVDSQSQSAA